MNITKATPLAYRNGQPKFEVAANGCWTWIGFKDRNGYGMCGVGFGEQYAHRAVYAYLRSPIPPAMTLDHVCRNRGCVNPDHLEVVSLAENVRRSPRTKLSPEAVQIIKSGSGGLTELARKFGVTKQAIYRVRKGLAWK